MCAPSRELFHADSDRRTDHCGRNNHSIWSTGLSQAAKMLLGTHFLAKKNGLAFASPLISL
jgi:hypothetical protein